MRRVALIVLLAGVVACPPSDPVELNDAGSQAFASRAVELMWGRTPTSSREVRVLADLADAGGREALIRAMARSPEYLEAWHDNLMDMTGVNRIGSRANGACYGVSGLGEDTPELAAFVRDNPAFGSEFGRPWTLYDLGRSSLLLDDLRPWFEADLYAHLVFDDPVMIAVETEAIRINLAELFQRNYLNREVGCLPCHNSASSVTSSSDPDEDRTWEVPGHFEAALFGGAHEGIPVSRLHGYFRRDGVIVGPTQGTDEENPPPYDPELTTPWGGLPICGDWGVPDDIREDRLEMPAFFVEEHGTFASMWDLEPILREGLDALAGGSIAGGEDALTVGGPEAFASLLALAVGEKVWREAFGVDLTLSHGFPRNQAQRDQLVHLANTFVGGNYSLVDVLVEVALHPYFVQRAPAEAVDTDTAYYLEPIFEPFSIEDLDPGRAQNSVGDQLVRRAARTALRGAYTALGWPALPDFPTGTSTGPGTLAYGDDAWVIQTLGLMAKDSSSGFRSLDFQTLLAWESWFGACTNPLAEPPADDWIDSLLASAAATGATVGEAAAALKDRILADPILEDEAERAAVQAVLGSPLSATLASDASPELEQGLRRVCGLWLSSPQFQLGGDPGPTFEELPDFLVVPGSSYREYCEGIRVSMYDGTGVACSPDGVEVL